MRMSSISVLLVAALAFSLGGCFQRGPQYAQYRYAPVPQAVQPIASNAMAAAPPPTYQNPVVYQAQPASAYQAQAAVPAYQAPAAQGYPVARATPVVRPPAPRGLIGSNPGLFARAPATRARVYAAPAATSAYAAYPQAMFESPYLLDAGDRLRITVFGQEGLTNAYSVDAAGNVTLPLVGTLPARGMTTDQLSLSLTEHLKQGYIREPKVAIEVEAYRPFFIHGEVTTPGQFAYVANMTVENAVAIAGGFSPRADRSKVTVSRTIGGQTSRAVVGLSYPLRPGDTLRIGERWF
jgi:polysaccharide export outer membrane protein